MFQDIIQEYFNGEGESGTLSTSDEYMRLKIKLCY